jgi:metal-responsive CopG/Arc/MetJ family transcriptional regulator
MKIAVSIPDDVFDDAERLVRRLNVSRSQLYATALSEYLARHDPDAVTAALNRLYEAGDGEVDAAVLAAGGQTLKRVEW